MKINAIMSSSTGSAGALRAVVIASALAFGCMLTGCNSTPPPTPLDQLNAQQMRGHTVFQANCAQCHYDRSSDAFHGPGLRGVMKKPYLPSGAPANDDRVTATIQHGRGMMPAQPYLDAQDTTDLLAYLHTL
jgi:mono/diheme cytochrome c family protein